MLHTSLPHASLLQASRWVIGSSKFSRADELLQSDPTIEASSACAVLTRHAGDSVGSLPIRVQGAAEGRLHALGRYQQGWHEERRGLIVIGA